jgi:hypothetical protein
METLNALTQAADGEQFFYWLLATDYWLLNNHSSLISVEEVTRDSEHTRLDSTLD